MNEYKNDNYITLDINEENESNELKEIINKYGDKYLNEMKIMQYESSDMGDIMEIYFFGIKLDGIVLYDSIYLSYILDGNNIEDLTIGDIREELLTLNLSEQIIKKKNIKEYISKEHNEKTKLYKYFKYSLIYKLFEKFFPSSKIIYNTKYIRRCFN